MSFIVENKNYIELPVNYNRLSQGHRKKVRDQYIELQEGRCFFCKDPLKGKVPFLIKEKKIKKNLFPEGFFNYPVHLHHDHDTGMTLGAVHAICNAVLWQYYGK
jgi:hypothetical protein